MRARQLNDAWIEKIRKRIVRACKRAVMPLVSDKFTPREVREQMVARMQRIFVHAEKLGWIDLGDVRK